MGGGRWGGHVRGSGESSEDFEHRRDRILEFPKPLCMHCGNTAGRGQAGHRGSSGRPLHGTTPLIN